MGKIAVFFRLVISIVLGFLPSFAFIWLFMRYGSPISNYINFMSNFEASKWAWILGVGIAFLIFIVWSIAKSKAPSKKYILTLIIFLLTIGAVLVFAQAYMYIKFFLGGDTLVQLSADKENIFFGDNTEESVSFETSVVLTPFCSAECSYEFFDLTHGREIERGNFTINPVLSKTKIFSLEREDIINGQSLKKFKVTCKSKKTRLCYTLEKENQKGILITINYGLTKEETNSIEEIKSETSSAGEELYEYKIRMKEDEANLKNMNKTILVADLLSSYKSISETFLELNSLFEIIKSSIENKELSYLNESINSFKTKFNVFKLEENKIRTEINSIISTYNQLIENISISRELIDESLQRNVTEGKCEELKSTAKEFNIAVSSFKTKNDISYKKSIINEVYVKAREINKDSEEGIGILCDLDESLSKESIAKIELVVINEIIPIISFRETDSKCCYYGICKECCDNSCSERNYPIIFLHGHSISSDTPADYSFDTLLAIKEKLASERYVDAGTLIISQLEEEKGLWGKADFTFMMTASYFFDVYKDKEGKFWTRTSNEDSIDTYALRLKEIIDIAKYKTGKDKVIIAAHSMGGVVTRRYIQIFGASDIDKLIFVTVPNHGTDSKVTGLCGILGSDVVCKDLDEDSLFINKLNNAPTEKPEVYNIIGVGCDMGGQTGDGILTNSSQYLDYANNYHIEGKCDELKFQYLHEEIGNPNKYPEAYNIIKTILKKK